MPGQTTRGNGPITGQEVLFTVNFTTPIDLPPDHYFFVPQVEVNGGEFLWLSGTRPNLLFPAGFTDLQSWTREQSLIQIGSASERTSSEESSTDFNAAFSLDGVETPLPGALPLFATGLGVLGLLGWRRKRKAQAAA